MYETLFFGYSKYHSVTSMLIELGLPSFDTLIVNSRVRLSHQCQATQNGIIGHMPLIFCLTFVFCLLSVSRCMCLCVLCFMFYGLKPEINAYIHSFIHSMLSALYAIVRPSVYPSVRPSVRHTG